MHFYGLSPDQVRKLKLKAFWNMHENIDRIRAEEDLRMGSLLGASLTGNQKYFDKLQKTKGQVVWTDKKAGGFDREGFERLRLMMGARYGK